MTQLPRREPYRAQNWKGIRFRAFVASILGRFPPLKRLVAYLYDNLTILMYQLSEESEHE
jgi:hypothetical protein